MKRVFFLLSSMNVGGVEKSFLALVSTLPKEQYEIHLGLLRAKGGLMDQIPPHIIVHKINAYDGCWPVINDPPRQTIMRFFKEGRWGEAAVLLFLYVLMKLTGSNYELYRFLLRKEPFMPESFDMAVAYAGPSQMIDYYICEKVRAKEKYGWIHFDVSRFGIDRGMTKRLYQKFDKIFVVSQEARDIFVRMFPQFKDKTEVYRNIVRRDQILLHAETAPTFTDKFSGKRLLTVGRISVEKGQRESVQALRLLIDTGADVKWYFVGEGKDMAYCRELADRLSVSDHLCFLGLEANPYGFMRDCDIYVQPSRHEGFCITLAEALCFDKPIVATRFAGATEQLEGRSNSIVTGFTSREIADGILRLIS